MIYSFDSEIGTQKTIKTLIQQEILLAIKNIMVLSAAVGKVGVNSTSRVISNSNQEMTEVLTMKMIKMSFNLAGLKSYLTVTKIY